MKKFKGFRGTEIILTNENRSLKKKIKSLQEENREFLKKIEILQWILSAIIALILFIAVEGIL